MGILAVEMEAAGLILHRRLRGKRARAICSISDIPRARGEELPPMTVRTTVTNHEKIALEVAVKMETKD